MRFSSRALRSISNGLTALSVLTAATFMLEQSHPGSTATANAASPSSQSAAQENLSRCLNALKVAEEKKIEEPKSYVLALAYTADAATQCDRELPKHTGPFYSEDGDRYFKLAVDLYAKNKWDKQNSDEIANMLYEQLGERSWKVVESVFEELFEASERHVEGKFERHDLSIYFGLSQREQKMPLQVQQKLLERAIEIRRIARKNESWRLAPLYDDLAWCLRDAGDIKGYDLSMNAHGGSGGFMHVIPPEGDGSSILSFGSISGSGIGYFGTIYCNNSTLTQRQNGRAKILPIEHVFQIQEGIDPPPDARTVVPVIEANVKMLERGDYILTDLCDLTVRPQTSSTPIRVFLQDSPDKKEFVLSLHGPPVSFRQFQVWYKGSKTIKLRSAGGLIYAPNARVELPFGTGFMGAIVAREFKSANASSVWLDRGVLNKNLTR